MAKKKVLVSVLNYNKVQDTIETIECFENQTYPDFDLQVIDSASTNDCVSKLRKRFPDLKIICLSENTGYTGGNNLALKIGLEKCYDYVLISNNDVMFDKNMLSNLVDVASSHPLSGVIGVIEQDYYTGEIRAIGGVGFNPLRGMGKWIETGSFGNKRIKVDYVQGAFLLFTRRALLSGLLFDNDLFMYCEEVDLGFQLKKKRLTAIVDTCQYIRHKSVLKKFSPFQGYYIQRNRLYLSRKYTPVYIYLLAVLYNALIELPIKVTIRSIQGHPYFAWACVLGFIDSLSGKMSIGRGFNLKSI